MNNIDKEMTLANKAWKELVDIPIDEDENIESAFRHFPVGTNKFDIWHWFEEEFGISVAKDLIYKNK